MCRILATKFREYQLKDLQQFDSGKLWPTYTIPDAIPDAKLAENTANDPGVFNPTDWDRLTLPPFEEANYRDAEWDFPK